MNGSRSLNLLGHLLMSPGVSTALSAERGQGATFPLSCPCSLPCGWVGAGAALPSLVPPFSPVKSPVVLSCFL